VAFVIYEEMIQLSHQKNMNREAAQKYEFLINNPDLLILDNVGSETGLGSETGHTAKTLDFILRKRDGLGVPTIISSNFTPEELKKNYSNTVYEFVSQNAELISVMGDNFRMKSSETASLLEDWED
jgi:DNA replication protein DnaC